LHSINTSGDGSTEHISDGGGKSPNLFKSGGGGTFFIIWWLVIVLILVYSFIMYGKKENCK